MVLKRMYHNYLLWEDYKNGLYILDTIEDSDKLIIKCANLLKDCKRFYDVMKLVIKDWKIATEVNLSNVNRNRQAWLGQASCCYMFKAPEYITKIAWKMLSKNQQDNANNTADVIINNWEKIYKNNGQKRLGIYA